VLDQRLFRHSILFGVALLSVQGTIYLLQFGAAAQMSAADYSTVRIIESLAAIGSLLATFGLPSVALVRVGVSPSSHQRRQLIRYSLGIVTSLSVLTAIGFWIAMRWGFLHGEVGGYLPATMCLSALMAFRLLLTAVTQSRQHYVRLATLSAVSCFLAVGTYAAFHAAGADRMVGWMLARIVLEGTICFGLLVTELGRYATTHGDQSERQNDTAGFPLRIGSLALLALPIGASLVARSLVDNGPVLWLAAMKVDSQLVARFGIFITIVAVALVPGGIVQGVAVPRLASSLQRGEAGGSYAMLFAGLGVLTAIGFAVLVLLSTLLVPWAHLATWDILLPGIVVVVAKMSASAMGGYLLVANRGKLIFGLNCTTLVMAASAGIILVLAHLPILLPVIVTVLAAIETSAAVCYGIAAALASRSAVVMHKAPGRLH
jgi:hypothetical protein